jgi:hypothetical protein
MLLRFFVFTLFSFSLTLQAQYREHFLVSDKSLESIGHQVVSTSAPNVLRNPEIRSQDFEIYFSKGSAFADVTFEIIPDSLEWVRVSSTWVLPRIKVRAKIIDSKKIKSASVFSAHRKIFLEKQSVSFWIPALQGVEHRVSVEGAAESISEKHFKIRYSPESMSAKHFEVDASCSMTPIHVQAMSSPRGWTYVGCRSVYGSGLKKPYREFEIHVWSESTEGVSERRIFVLNPHENILEATLPAHDIKVSYRLGERIPLAFMGAGLGGYNFRYDSETTSAETWAPVLTTYASYFVSDANRIVFFASGVLNRLGFVDMGLYLKTESAVFLDDRVRLYLLIGAQALAIPVAGSGRVWVPSAPQGVEFIFSDFFQRNDYLMAGAFIYPSIAGKSYSNVYLRWARPQYFIEFNYIRIEENLRHQRVVTSQSGISLGKSLLGFF